MTDLEPWHAIPASEVVDALATSIGSGLGSPEAAGRLQKYGPNRLPEGGKREPFIRFLTQFNNVLVYVLLAAGFIQLMMSFWVDAAVIFGVVVLNALLGFIQEGRAEKALESIRNMLSAEARTLRDGVARLLSAEQLVPGDVVLLESGDRALRYMHEIAEFDPDPNCAGGVRIAGLAGIWQTFVVGFAGLDLTGDLPAIDPKLPEHWRGLSFRAHWRGRWIGFRITPATAEATLLEGEPMEMRIGQAILRLAPGAPVQTPVRELTAATPEPAA